MPHADPDALRIVRHPRVPEAGGVAVAIGNFDGMHRGHRAVIGEAVLKARSLGCRPALLSFAPHPRRFFKPDSPPFMLTALPARARAAADLGVERFFLLRFDAAMAGLSAEAFIDEVLLSRVGARHVVIGYDFVFGKGRKGTPEMMRARLANSGVPTTVVAPVISPDAEPDAGLDALVVSSTGVRHSLMAGDPEEAARLLGVPFEIEGRVRHGDARGRELGYPTANVPLDAYVRPAYGIYAVRVGVAAPGTSFRRPWTWYDGVANLGVRPMFELARPLLEAHLFDFRGDLYGRRVRVQLIAYLRPEMKFAGLAELKSQIDADAARARSVLAGPDPSRLPAGR